MYSLLICIVLLNNYALTAPSDDEKDEEVFTETNHSEEEIKEECEPTTDTTVEEVTENQNLFQTPPATHYQPILPPLQKTRNRIEFSDRLHGVRRRLIDDNGNIVARAPLTSIQAQENVERIREHMREENNAEMYMIDSLLRHRTDSDHHNPASIWQTEDSRASNSETLNLGKASNRKRKRGSIFRSCGEEYRSFFLFPHGS